MARFDGSAALKLDFGTPRLASGGGRSGPSRLRLAPSGRRGDEKYQVLEHRRRQAQIKARRLLDLLGQGE